MDKKHSHSTHTKNHKPKKKKIGLFYKISLSLLLIVSLTLAYFLVLVSAEPKSMPFLTQKIELVLEKKFGDDVAVSESYISFTRYGTLKVAITGVKILYSPPNSKEKQAFVLPKLETEFSLLNALLLRFQPSKVKIIDPTIVLDDLSKMNQKSGDQNSSSNGDLSFIINFISSVKTGKFPIRDFEIENAKIFVKGSEFDTEILLKKSQIRTSIKEKVLYFSSTNKLNFEAEKSDVDLNSNCQLSERDGLKCDLSLVNFVADSIADLHPSLNALNQIDAELNAAASFVIKNNQLGNIVFKAEAKKGDFEFTEFFGQKMNFSNFSVAGEYNNEDGVLNLTQIKTDFEQAVFDQNTIANNLISDPAQLQKELATSFDFKSSKPHLEMSLLISGLKNSPMQKLDFNIKLKDVPNDEMEKFWPRALSHNDIRAWVIAHIKSGLIEDAYARFSLLKNAENYDLENIDAEVKFSGFNLGYSSDFPSINNLSGKAKFSKQGMKISLNGGEVLNSKISTGLVAINDFQGKQVFLEISGKSQGSAADSLKHANNQPAFATEIEKYLNGNSQNDFDIRIPLHQEITLQNSYIAVNSTISSLSNDYTNGDVKISSKKDFASNDFITSVDLTAANLTATAFDVVKKAGAEAALNLVVSITNPQKIALKNIVLWKKEAEKISKIAASAEFETSPFLLTSLSLSNSNFGKNNYSFSYQANRATNLEKIVIKGQQLNLASFIEQKFFAQAPKKTGAFNSQIQVALSNINLAHNKLLKNFSLFLNCENNLCNKGKIKGTYSKKQFIEIGIKENPNGLIGLDGRISDIGYLSEGLGIANTISGGDAKIKMLSKLVDKKVASQGSVTIDNNITIYENEAVKRLAKNNLFSVVKDKIFSNNKTTFDSVKLEFGIANDVLNIESLVANNYKIGITAKGAYNFKNNTFDIKGMIVPGFIINNLFGIGKIPILGNVISGLLTGGEGGGVFGIRYQYVKKNPNQEATFETNKISSFVPTTIKSLFDLI